MCVQYRENGPDEVRELLILVVVGDHDTSDNSGNDGQQQDEEAETDPSLLAGSSSRYDCLVCVLDTGRDDVNDGEETFLDVTYPLEASCSMSWAVF